MIEGAGFARTTIGDHWMRPPFLPANSQISGVATKGGWSVDVPDQARQG